MRAALLFCLFLHATTAWGQSLARENPAHGISLDVADFSDLEFLRPLLEGRRLVQLGENTHGVKEYNLAKARIVRFLHQELGFDVLAFESDIYQCHVANERAAEVPAVSTLTNCVLGVWHTREVLPLFEYLRASHGTESPLLLAGIDVQPIGPNKAGRPRFLARAASTISDAYAAEVHALDSTFLAVYGQGGRERRAFFRSEAGRKMAEAYQHLASVLSGVANEDIRIARRTARSLMWYIRQQAAPSTLEYVEHRDEGMAENLRFLLEELYPDRKIIVWGHNFHLRHDNLSIPPDTTMFPDVAARTMGTWIHDEFGDQVYTIGLYAYRGRAANNSGEVFEIVAANEGSVEAGLHEIGRSPLFIDLKEASAYPQFAWMDISTTARFNGTTPLWMRLRDQYDAILFFDHVNPREPF